MKTVFIEGTNEKYSIREDGRIIKHYEISPHKKIKKTINKLLKKQAKHSIKINNVGVSIRTHSLTIKHFGHIYCNKCNDYTSDKEDLNKINFRMCKKCAKKEMVKNVAKWKKKNPLIHKKHQKTQTKKHINNISKNYTCHLLQIPIDSLKIELYNAKKQQLILHRTIQNLKISQL